MASLWEIDRRFYDAFDAETGEILDEQLLADLEMEREEKLSNICHWIKNLQSDAEAYKAQKAIFADKQKQAENKAKSLMRYLQGSLHGQKWEAADKSVKVSYRTTKDKVTIDELELIPEEFFKTPRTESNLNKTMVKEILLSGKDIEGVHLEDSVSMSVK